MAGYIKVNAQRCPLEVYSSPPKKNRKLSMSPIFKVEVCIWISSFHNWCSLHIHVSGLCSCSDHMSPITSCSQVFLVRGQTIEAVRDEKVEEMGREVESEVTEEGKKMELKFVIVLCSVLFARAGWFTIKDYNMVSGIPGSYCFRSLAEERETTCDCGIVSCVNSSNASFG